MNIKILLRYTIIFTFTILNLSIGLQTINELCEDFPIGTRIPHPEDCNLYLKCTKDNNKSFALVISCQNNIFFNPNTLECDPNYESEICPKPKTSPIFNRSTTTKRKTKKTTTLRTKTTRSTQKKTKQTNKSTSTKTTIEPTIIPDDYEYYDDLTTTPINTNNGIHCPEIDNDQVKFLENLDDCTKYYMCYHGRALPLRCWNGLHFSMKHMTCTPPEIANCSANATPYPNCPIFGRALLPHPEECRYFFYCTNGIKTIQQCGSFDYWDIIEKKLSVVWIAFNKHHREQKRRVYSDIE
ncbi:uncharacterized protein LOC129607505 [Condylostylus longicornis]|uniref:uncharacterized protein LOC129607505 n=1 Tax=Condylostylus longicornis TaxID=2530218 RepID=UPI00244E5AC3|nr:uncharacterized protein LOC129607505 [Condylostylus longicornis]